MKKLFLLLTTSLFLLQGCNKEDTDQTRIEKHIQQGWKLTASSINGLSVNIALIPLDELILFSEQNLCYLATPVYINEEWSYEDQRTAWNYDHSNRILNIVGMLPVSNYIEKIENNQLVIHYYLYNENGELDKYEKDYRPANIVIKDLTIRLTGE